MMQVHEGQKLMITWTVCAICTSKYVHLRTFPVENKNTGKCGRDESYRGLKASITLSVLADKV